MAEPWLESLSEDWNSQPTSSSPKSLPSFGTPSASVRSRIPRYSHKSQKDASGSLKRPRNETPGVRRALSERSVSGINIAPHSSPRLPSPKSEQRQRANTASSVASVGSVVKCSSLARRDKSSSPTRSKDRADTPEWKKLVLNVKGPMAQADLFSPRPLGLQSIFEQPPDTPIDDTTRRSPRLAFIQGLDSMPSSPPPWPRSHRGSALTFAETQAQRNNDGLDSILEQQEDEHEDDSVVEAHEQFEDDSISQPDVNAEQPGPLEEKQTAAASNVNWIPQHQLPLDTPASSERSLDHSHLKDSLDHDVESQDKQDGLSRNSKLSIHSSSTTGGFSPVFISKHNTVDGRVDYTAVDISKPETQELVNSYTSAASRPRKQSSSASSKPLSQSMSTDSPHSGRSSDLAQPKIGEFVSIERGGYSDEDSFKRRPLSPSASSSIVPSDSISQVHSVRRASNQNPPRQSEDDQHVLQSTRNVFDEPSLSSMTAVASEKLIEAPHGPSQLAGSSTHDDDGMGCGSNTPHLPDDLERPETSDDGTGTAPSVETVLHRSGPDASAQLPAELERIQLRPLTPQQNTGYGDKDDASKRSVGSSAKVPTPKRRRTLGQIELQPAAEHVSEVVQEQHRRLQAMIGKRKDARYDDDYASCDPETLAKRQILRPRNSSVDTQHQLPGSEVARNVDLAEDDFEVRDLALKAATVRINAVRGNSDLFRKASVSTKDYLDEAMKIMECIRLKREAPLELSSPEESVIESLRAVGAPVSRDFTPQNISRPPSREGFVSAWRSRDGRPLDARVASHLQKYQETQDESFLVSSVLEYAHTVEETNPTEEEDSTFDRESPRIRIFSPLHDRAQPESPVKTNSSHQSAESGRTTQTNLSQRSRTVPNIAPDQVSHLLNAETNGMRFDAAKNTWVKAKPRGPSFNVSSSTGTEDDPFLHIPDLSVNESDNQEVPEPMHHTRPSEFRPDMARDYKDPHCEGSDDLDESDHISAVDVSSSAPPNPFAVPSPRDREAIVEMTLPVLDRMGIEEHSPSVGAGTANKLSKVPSGTVRSKHRSTLDMTSSPSRAQMAVSNHLNINDISYFEDSVHSHGDQSLSNPTGQLPFLKVDNSINPSNERNPTLLQAANYFSSTRKHDKHEISLVKTRPDGRTMSLTLSVSTPLSGLRRQSRQLIPSSGARGSNIWQSMSPLSDFTMHQDDARHLHSRQLATSNDKREVTTISSRAPNVVKSLVEKITDAEPEEVDWDFMQTLVLAGRDLDNIHMLNEFCPRVDDLDITRNSLKHLDGAPSRIRHLKAARNQLSSLTSWAHLVNLQYLDISGNGIETLGGLGGLVHLRELKADDNNIVDIEGIFDLDGLLSLSLNNNRLRKLDFTSAAMDRLETLSVQHNLLHDISGLRCLRSLKQLDISNNDLSCFPNAGDTAGRCQQLRSLRLARNNLTSINVSPFLRLEQLDVDSNNLSGISNIACLGNLQRLSIRSQIVAEDSKSTLADFVPSCTELTHLYLSGNMLPELTCTLAKIDCFPNLQVLELALCSLTSLPNDFATIFPNLRALNLNFNALRDLRPLRGVRRLRQLHLAGNRISRLRRTITVLDTLRCSLEEVDLRDNPLVNGFYPPSGFGTAGLDVPQAPHGHIRTDEQDAWWDLPRKAHGLQHLLPASGAGLQDERLYVDRLDEDTKLRRRVYELMLAAKCPMLTMVDGREWERDRIVRRDALWERLVGLGVVEVVDKRIDELEGRSLVATEA